MLHSALQGMRRRVAQKMATNNNLTCDCSTDSSNCSCDDRESNYSVESIKSFVILMNFFVILFGTVLNLTVLIASGRRKRLRSEVEACHCAITHLCIASLLIAVVSLPINTVWQITFEWKAGLIGCKLFMSVRVVGFYMASFTITYLSICR